MQSKIPCILFNPLEFRSEAVQSDNTAFVIENLLHPQPECFLQYIPLHLQR